MTMDFATIPGERTPTGVTTTATGMTFFAGAQLPRGYWNQLVALENSEKQRDAIQSIYNRGIRVMNGEITLTPDAMEVFRNSFATVGLIGTELANPTLGDMMTAARSEIQELDGQIEQRTDTLFNLSAPISAAMLPDKLDPKRREDYGLSDPNGNGLVEVEIGGTTFRVSAESAASLAERRYEYNSLSAGDKARLGQDMFFYNNLSAFQVEQIDLQLRTEDRLDEQLVFQIEDSRRNFEQRLVEFEASSAIAERGLDLQFQGLQLEARGQLITAIGQDFARQIEMGRMQYEEANLQLNRINVAFTQRREERKQVLNFAVKDSSLRMRDGQQVTQLPFAGQFAKILGQATGQQFSIADFELSTTTIDPNQTMLDILGASDFESPIPGLNAGLQNTRDAIEGMLGGQQGSQAVTETEVASATQGV